jgi:hypothetical protein
MLSLSSTSFAANFEWGYSNNQFWCFPADMNYHPLPGVSSVNKKYCSFEWGLGKYTSDFGSTVETGCFPAFHDGKMIPNSSAVSNSLCKYGWANGYFSRIDGLGTTIEVGCFPALRSGQVVPNSTSVSKSKCLKN